MKDKNARVLALILGGGKGTRLYPLTKVRSKPAVSFGGKFRIVDIAISNCINSDYKKIYLLTQFNSESLHTHIVESYNFDRFSGGFVSILAAEQSLEHSGWYEGTADSVRKNFLHFSHHKPTHYIILSGDQLYKMDLQDFFNEHVKSGADCTIATTIVNRRDASGFGIMKIDENKRILEFMEKPGAEKNIDEWKIPSRLKGADESKEYLASMGIYIFNADVLKETLDNNYNDFGKEVIPAAIKTKKINAYLFSGYWEDIGTIRSFYEANMELTKVRPAFDFYNESEPIYTNSLNLPPSKINRATISSSLTSEGCILSETSLTDSVIGIRSIIETGSELNGVIMMGADFYESEEERERNRENGIPSIGVGQNCKIARTIIDKNARIGNNVRINVSGKKYEEGQHDNFFYSDGIVVILKDAVIPDNTEI